MRVGKGVWQREVYVCWVCEDERNVGRCVEMRDECVEGRGGFVEMRGMPEGVLR